MIEAINFCAEIEGELVAGAVYAPALDDLYLAEKVLLLSPEIIHTVSFDYQNKWYISVQVDEAYLDRTNIDIDDVERKLNGIRQRINAYLPPENMIRFIDVTTCDLILNKEGKPVRFVHKMEED